jgi:hypothetical protein
MRPILLVTVASLALAAGGGCTSYYRVTDPTTNRVYYTSNLDRRGSGAVRLRDARTGGEVALQNSQVEKISKELFESSKHDSGSAPKTESRF